MKNCISITYFTDYDSVFKCISELLFLIALRKACKEDRRVVALRNSLY